MYEVDAPFQTDIVKKTIATGTIVPRKEIELKSQVSGVVEELYFDEGDSVKIGDLIAKIRIIPDVVAVNNATAQLETARINFENAQKELNRQRELYENNVISEFDYNAFYVDFQLRQQDLRAAESNLELVKEGSSQRTGNVSNLVRSTVDGMILDVPVKPGTFIIESNTFNEGTTIASVADMEEMIFEGQVDESDVGKIEAGMELVLAVGAIEGKTFDGILEFISPKGEDIDGGIKFEVKAAVTLRDDVFLRAGYSANADIVLDKRVDILAIKESNLIFEEDKIFVEVMTGEQEFERVEVETGLSDGINIEVLSGIDADAQIKRL